MDKPSKLTKEELLMISSLKSDLFKLSTHLRWIWMVELWGKKIFDFSFYIFKIHIFVWMDHILIIFIFEFDQIFNIQNLTLQENEFEIMSMIWNLNQNPNIYIMFSIETHIWRILLENALPTHKGILKK